MFVTGMSGAGKSSVLRALAGRGFEVVDTDEPGWIEVVGGERLWREDRVAALLDRARDRPVFVGGTVRNQVVFASRFDAVVLLTAPIEVLLERIRLRSTNDFGKRDAEREAVIQDHRDVEPLLHASATHVIDTREPLDEVVARLIRFATE